MGCYGPLYLITKIGNLHIISSRIRDLIEIKGLCDFSNDLYTDIYLDFHENKQKWNKKVLPFIDH